MKRTGSDRSRFNLRGLAFGAACLIIVPIVSAIALFRPDAPAKHSQRTLTFAERVAYQLISTVKSVGGLETRVSQGLTCIFPAHLLQLLLQHRHLRRVQDLHLSQDLALLLFRDHSYP